MTSILTRNAANTARTKPTTGDIKQSFVTTNHLGWLLCNGDFYDKIAYNLLYQVIGDTFLPAGGNPNASYFYVPDMRGHVTGNIGTITEPCGVFPFNRGDKTGEVMHQLTIGEMPAHNHDDTTANQTSTKGVPAVTPTQPVPGVRTVDGNTSSSATGITINTHTTGITDGGHRHDYTVVNGTLDTYQVAGGTSQPYDSVTATPSALGYADIQDPGHLHTITDVSHYHTIASNGGDQCHNNMQPTIFYGNTFIYSGVPIIGAPNVPTVFPFGLPRPNPVLI